MKYTKKQLKLVDEIVVLAKQLRKLKNRKAK